METGEEWTLPVTSPDIRKLFDSFEINVPEDPTQASFARSLLSAVQCDTIVHNIKLLSKKAVLLREISSGAGYVKSGSIHVFEVEVSCKKGKLVVNEKVCKSIFNSK